MNACRFAILTPVLLILLVGTAAAQAPQPLFPTSEPPVSETRPPLAALPPDLSAPQAPPTQVPGVPDMGFPPVPPNLPPSVPNLQTLPPDEIEGFGMPPGQPRTQPSDNPLLKLFDTDGNGILSGNEVEQAPARLWELDRNFDAQLSPSELALVLAPRWQERRRGIPGYLPAEPMQVEPQLPAGPERKLGNERPQFEVYPLRGLDPARTLATLQQLFGAQPDARLTFDARTQSILALAPSGAHAEIRKALAELLEGDRTGIPGLAPGMAPAAAAETALPVVPRPVPLHNTRVRDVLRIVKQIFRDRITEPPAQPLAAQPRFPGAEPPFMDEPTVPAGKMVIGEGADPNTIVISAQDELFFEVLDLIERLDERPEPAGDMQPSPVN